MNSRISRKMTGQVIKSFSVGMAGAAMALGVWAQLPYFSGPSIAKPAAPTKFSGQGFAANAAVTVMVKAPDGAAAGYSAVTKADGSFNYTLVPSQAGAYTITVTDSGGATLAKAVLAVLP